MLRFGPFEVNFETGELRKSGVRVRIQEQPLRILQTLLERPGELVTREELRGRLWPSDTFVDFERSLNAAMGKLRQSLNDSANRPRYIETTARKGYRFIAAVTGPDTSSLPAVVVESPPLLPSRNASLWQRLAAGAALGILLLVVLAVWSRARTNSERQVLALDLEVGSNVSQPAISKDGMTLVFVAGGSLAIRRLGLAEAAITSLAGTEGAAAPFFSPDAKWVGYFAGHELRKVPTAGGQSIRLCAAPYDRGATWTDDGHIIAALSASGELSRVPIAGGTPQPFDDLSGDAPEVTNHRSPVALPDGKGVLFVSGPGVATGRLRVRPRGGGPARTLVENASTGRYVAGFLLFNRAETMFAAPMDLDRLELTGPESPLVQEVAYDHFRGADFDVSISGNLVYRRSPPKANRAVVWLSSSGVESRILPMTGQYSSPRLSPDGKRLAYSSESQIWIYDLARQKTSPLTFGLAGQCCPVWTLDGEYVAFSSQATLSWARPDGSGSSEQLPLQGAAVPFSFSPDGNWLAFHQNQAQTGYDILAAAASRTDGTLRLAPANPLVAQPGLQTAPAISPDGRWLAYGSDSETGRLEVYVIPFSPQAGPREGKWQVSTDGGRGPKWSRDGNEIFFRTPDDHLMSAVVTSKGKPFQTEKPRLWSTQRLATVGPSYPNFDVSLDRKRVIAIIDAGETKSDDTHLRVLLNVDQELQHHIASRAIPR